MPIDPHLDACVFSCQLTGPCGHAAGAIALGPLKDRALSAFSAVAAGIPATRCPDCGGELTVESVDYVFDEDDLPPLTYDVASQTLTCSGEEVSSEEQLHDLIGRPFSLTGFHLPQLRSVTDYLNYEPSPGVVVSAFACDPDDPDQHEHLEAQAEQAIAAVEETVTKYPSPSSPCPMPLGWYRDQGVGAWVGDLAESLRNETLLVQSVVRADLLAEALTNHNPPAPKERLQVSVETDGGFGVRVSRAGLSALLNLERYGQYTFTKALTIDEVASYAYYELDRMFETVSQAIGLIDEKQLQGWNIEPGPRLAQNEDQRVSISLLNLCLKLDYDPELLAERVSNLMRYSDDTSRSPGVAPKQMPCGCAAHPSLILRDAEFARDGRSLAVPYQDGAVCAVVDCDHQIIFLQTTGDTDADEAQWERCVKGTRTQRFRLAAKPIHDVSGRLVGAVVMGNDAASPICHPALVRGLAQACGLPTNTDLAMATATTKLAVIGLAGTDPELLKLEIAQVARDRASDRQMHGARALSVARIVEAGKERHGHFELEGLVFHEPLHRFTASAAEMSGSGDSGDTTTKRATKQRSRARTRAARQSRKRNRR